jgi:hypothetical protein
MQILFGEGKPDGNEDTFCWQLLLLVQAQLAFPRLDIRPINLQLRPCNLFEIRLILKPTCDHLHEDQVLQCENGDHLAPYTIRLLRASAD